MKNLSYSTVGCCRSEKVTPSWLDMDGALLHIWRVDDRTLINATYNFYNICNVPSNRKLNQVWVLSILFSDKRNLNPTETKRSNCSSVV